MPDRIRHRTPHSGRRTDPRVVSATVGTLFAAAGLLQPVPSVTPAAPFTPATLAQARPQPPMCPPPRPAQPDPVIHEPAGRLPFRRDAAGVARSAPPAPDPRTPPVTDLWTGGRAPIRPGRYAYFATRTLRYSDYPDLDRESFAVRYPLEQTDVASWQAADGADFGVVVRDYGVPGQQPVRWPYRFAPRTADPSQLTIDIQAWSADPAVLTTQVAAWDQDDPRPTYVLQAIAIRYRAVLPTPAQHAAALTVLCSTPGVRLLGPTTDRAGRPGIAVTADHDYGGDIVQHATLILDPHTWRPQSVSVSTSGYPGSSREDRTILLLHAGYHDVIS